MLSGAFPLPYRGLRGGSAFDLGFISELQSARGQRPRRVLAYPKTDAGDKCEAVAARTKVGDYIKEIGDGRPLSPTQGCPNWRVGWQASLPPLRDLPAQNLVLLLLPLLAAAVTVTSSCVEGAA
jgi:hypothetical protein